jgi:hypothetical protein
LPETHEIPEATPLCGAYGKAAPWGTIKYNIRGRVEMMFIEESWMGGYEVVSKPPLGKC